MEHVVYLVRHTQNSSDSGDNGDSGDGEDKGDNGDNGDGEDSGDKSVSSIWVLICAVPESSLGFSFPLVGKECKIQNKLFISVT